METHHQHAFKRTKRHHFQRYELVSSRKSHLLSLLGEKSTSGAISALAEKKPIELRELFASVYEVATKSQNKKWLQRRLAEALEVKPADYFPLKTSRTPQPFPSSTDINSGDEGSNGGFISACTRPSEIIYSARESDPSQVNSMEDMVFVGVEGSGEEELDFAENLAALKGDAPLSALLFQFEDAPSMIMGFEHLLNSEHNHRVFADNLHQHGTSNHADNRTLDVQASSTQVVLGLDSYQPMDTTTTTSDISRHFSSSLQSLVHLQPPPPPTAAELLNAAWPDGARPSGGSLPATLLPSLSSIDIALALAGTSQSPLHAENTHWVAANDALQALKRQEQEYEGQENGVDAGIHAKTEKNAAIMQLVSRLVSLEQEEQRVAEDLRAVYEKLQAVSSEKRNCIEELKKTLAVQKLTPPESQQG